MMRTAGLLICDLPSPRPPDRGRTPGLTQAHPARAGRAGKAASCRRSPRCATSFGLRGHVPAFPARQSGQGEECLQSGSWSQCMRKKRKGALHELRSSGSESAHFKKAEPTDVGCYEPQKSSGARTGFGGFLSPSVRGNDGSTATDRTYSRDSSVMRRAGACCFDRHVQMGDGPSPMFVGSLNAHEVMARFGKAMLCDYIPVLRVLIDVAVGSHGDPVGTVAEVPCFIAEGGAEASHFESNR